MAGFDPWDGEDSGGMSEYELTIHDPRFEYIERDQGARPRLRLRGEAKTDDGKIVDWTPEYTIVKSGTKVDISPDGKQIAFVEDDENRYFHKESAIMHLVKAARKTGAPITSRGFPNAKYADLFKGLKFRMKSTVMGSFDSDREKNEDGTPKQVQWKLDLPVEYLGEVGESPSANPAFTTSPAPVAGGSGAPTATVHGEVSDGELKVMASEAADFFSFVDAATKRGVPIADERLKQATGIWAEVRS